MLNGKEVDIISYLEWEEEKIEAEKEMAENPTIGKLREKLNAIKEEINVQEYEYREKIKDCGCLMHRIKVKIVEEWDNDNKSFKCDNGTATIRTTKSLIVTDNWALIERLADILNDKKKAFDCIRSFDLSSIRKYMDVDLIDGDIAHYDEKRNVVISAAKKDIKE